MKSLISIIFLSIILTHCGFKPIYNSKSSNFEVIEIINKNKNKNSFTIEKMIMSLSNQSAEKKVKLELNYEHLVTTILKDSKGDPSKKKLTIIVNLKVKNHTDKFLVDKNFKEEFSYDVQSDNFSLGQYEDNITINLNNKISNDIIFLLGTLE